MIKTISSLMETPLPSKRKQKKLVFKPTRELAYEVYTALNHIVFNNTLNQNPQILYRSLVRYWGQCVQYDCNDTLSCKILLDRRFYCAQWFTTILAHEMCHAYEWEVMKLKLTPDEEHISSYLKNLWHS